MRVLTRALILCNNEDKAAGRSIVLKPRVQAEMLQCCRKKGMKPEAFIHKFSKKNNADAVFRVANVAMVIAGAAGYIQTPKSWLPKKAAQDKSSIFNAKEETIVTPQSVRMALTYMASGNNGVAMMSESNETFLIQVSFDFSSQMHSTQ